MKKKLLIVLGVVFLVFGIAYASWHYDALFIRPNTDQTKTLVVQDSDGVEVFSVNTSTAGVVVTGTQSISGITTQTGALNVAGTLSAAGTMDFAGRINAGTGFWDDAPSIASNDASVAFFYFEDFIGTKLDSAGGVLGAGIAKLVQSGTDATLEGWKHFGDAGWTMTQPAGTLGGQLILTPHTDSNDEFSMSLGELGTETFVEITESSGKEFWLEYRMAVVDTSKGANFFIGLAEEGRAVTDGVIADAGNDVADMDYLGFISWEATGGDTVAAFFQTASGAFVDTFETKLGEAQTTYGIHFDGDSTITWYINGTAIGSVEQDIALFPDTEELTPLISIKQGDTDDHVLTFDWIKLVSER